MTSDEAALRSRHIDTLKARLQALDALAPPVVEIVVSHDSGVSWTGQHLVIHLANLLGRLAGVVAGVRVTGGGAHATLRAGVYVHRAEGGGSLEHAAVASSQLSRTGTTIRRNSNDGDQPILRCYVGTAPADQRSTSNDAVHVAAGVWTASVRRSRGPECVPDVDTARSPIAIGAYVAAALATGEIFKMVRARDTSRATNLVFDAWCWSPCVGLEEGDAEAMRGGADGIKVLSPCTLAGVGAVGTACLLTLWASHIAVTNCLVIDGDVISLSNLNRYVLFGRQHLGSSKASSAARLLERGGDRPFVLQPVDAWWAEYVRASAPSPIALLISTVDSNRARHQLQDHWPRVILGASTKDLRVEVARYNLAADDSRCLKCFNTPEVIESDADMRARLLAMSTTELAHEAVDRGVAHDALIRYTNDLRAGGTGCAVLAGPALDRLRRADGEGAFAVSFVSSLAGSLLAVQLLREGSDAVAPLLDTAANRAIMQLWTPDAPSNRPFAAPLDPSCPCGAPAYRAVFRKAWQLPMHGTRQNGQS